MNLNARLAIIYNWYIQSQGITQKSFAETIGISTSQLSSIIKGRDKAGLSIVEKFLNLDSNIDANWLLTGEGKMLKNDGQNDEQNDELTPKIEENTPVLQVAETKQEYNEPKNKVVEETVTSERKLVPFFDAVVQAGTQVVAEMNNDIYPVEMVDAGDFFQDATAVMAVHGDSMFPDYRAGSLIAIKEVNNKRLVIPGNDYVVETSEYRVIKRLKQNIEDKTCWIACSTNMEKWDDGPFRGQLIYEPFEVPIDEILHLYLVLGKIERNHSSKIIHNTL